MENFQIIKLDNNEFDAMVIMLTSYPPLEYKEKIREKLIKKNIFGKIIIDQLLHNGNDENRFIYFYLEKKTGKYHSFQFVDIEKKSIIREKSDKFLLEKDLINNSILTSIQKKMLQNGIII